uniref:Retrovirus-related Pol polyprotein from transposon TNT 1-94 n=1 Tax=Tanacetum cinerariifolium TaxID=118510 RepID=A0A6L2J8F7_TANCI|nr:retrovirus-related Pol polyprotein from transposon TNT 1-94 [Tanacetum cinerariifolium]
MLNNSQGKKQEVEDHRRNVKFSKNKTSVTACNDSLNAKISNVNFVCVTCGKYVLNGKHDMCVLHSLNGVNSRTKMPMVVPISTRKPKRIVNQYVAKPLRRTVALDFTNQKPIHTRKLYEHVSKACSWWYPNFTPPGYEWKPKSQIGNANPKVSMPLGNASRTANILEPMTPRCSTVSNTKLYSNSFAAQNLEVTFRKSTCYIRDLKGNDLLTGSRGTDLYSITLQDTSSSNPICLMAKATSSQAWLWHRCLSHLNFDTINLLSKNDIMIGLLRLKFVKDHLCSFYELGKAKRKSFQTKTTPSSKRRLQLLHMDLCGPMWVESINGKKYVFVIVDDYSRYTWTHFLRSKDETPKVIIDFLRLVQRGLHAQVRIVQTNKGTEFLNKTLHAYFASEGINHQTSVARTPEQKGVVKTWNRTLVEAARTMLSAAKVPLFFWAEAIATTCFTQNRSLVIPRHEKTPYHIINDWKPSVKFFHIFGSLCYIVKDGENLDKMNGKGDAYIFVGYSTQSRAYRVFNKRTRVIVETIHVNFDELPHMASDHVKNVPQAAGIVTTSNELDFLFSLMFDGLLNGSTQVVSKSSAVTIDDAPNQYQGETSSRHVDSSNMHTFYQRHPSEHRWTKDHSLEQVIGNPSQLVRTRRHLESDGEMCMFALTVSQTEPKNIKEAIADSVWIDSIQEEVHQFGRLDEEVYVNQPDGFVDPYHLDKVYRLKKALYGLKQATRACKFEMTIIEELKFFLGIQIQQSPGGIFINQAKYAQEILIKHGMTSCDSIGTPMGTKHLDANLSGTPVDQTKYRSMVGALMYLTVSRPDIVHATCYCARYQAKLTEKHLTTVKRIFWYLKDTINMGLWYVKDISFKLTAFSYSDYAGCLDSRKRTSGGKQFLVLWMRTQLTDYGFHFDKIPTYCGSKAAIAISCNPVQHSRTKHIDVIYHFIKEKVEKGIIELFFVGTEYQLADLFTKALSEDRIPFDGQAVFTNEWDLGALEYSQEIEVERVIRPLALRQARRPRSDNGKACHFISSTSAHHNRRSSSRQEDDNEDDGASLASTPSPTTYLNSLKPFNYQQY